MYDNEPTMMGHGRPTANLVIRQGPQAGMSFPLTGNQIVIGREEGTDVPLHDPEASRRHALVSWQGGQYVIEDLGSTNGTFVNGIQLTAPQALNPGDSIGIGQTALVFHMTDMPRGGGIPKPPAPTYVAPPPEPVVAGQSNKTTQYVLYGIGCLLLICICLLLAVAVWVLAFPESIEQLTQPLSTIFTQFYPGIA
ncbi:MAG: FHA domain-containing protein [Chloroflexota bacterium]